MEEVSSTQTEAVAPINDFLRQALDSEFDITGEKVAELRDSIDAALIDLEQFRKDIQEANRNEATKVTREHVHEFLAQLYPDVAQLIQKPYPDFELLHPSLRGLISRNPKVKEQHNIMFNSEGKPRDAKSTPINVVKWTLLQVRPALVFAHERSIKAVERLNKTDQKALDASEAVA